MIHFETVFARLLALAGLAGLAGLAVAMICGCPSVSAYLCAQDSDCDRNGSSAGVCLEDNACAYPVPADQCPSGLLRSPNARVQARECVPLPSGDDGLETTSSDEGTDTTGSIPDCGSSLILTLNPNLLSAFEDLPGYPLLVETRDATLVQTLRDNLATLSLLDDEGSDVPFELVDAAVTPDAFSAWVSVPAYSLGKTLQLTLSWGTRPTTNNPREVWNGDYLAVWHFDDPLSGVDGDPVANSVVAIEAGVASGTMQPEQAVEGIIGGGWSFDGDDDAVTVNAAFVGTLDSFTVSLWSRYEGDDDGPTTTYFHRLNGEYLLPRCWREDPGNIACQYALTDSDTQSMETSFVHMPGATMHLALVRDARTRTTLMYINGVLRDTITNDDLPLQSGGFPFEIGRGEWGTADAMIDEVRVSDYALSEAWIAADYVSQSDPTLAVSFSQITPVPCP